MDWRSCGPYVMLKAVHDFVINIEWFGNIWKFDKDVEILFVMMGCRTDSSGVELHFLPFTLMSVILFESIWLCL